MFSGAASLAAVHHSTSATHRSICTLRDVVHDAFQMPPLLLLLGASPLSAEMAFVVLFY